MGRRGLQALSDRAVLDVQVQIFMAVLKGTHRGNIWARWHPQALATGAKRKLAHVPWAWASQLGTSANQGFH